MTNREQVVAAAMDDIRRIEADLGITRAGVEAIRDRLIEMAANRDAFDLADFPAPGDDDEKNSFMYRLSEDDDGRFALYAQRSRGHVETPPHNHTTWAVVVGFSGEERNVFYERLDDGQGVTTTHEHLVCDGTGVAMLPDDLHSIHLDAPALNFHCYGLALEKLAEREYWNEREGRWKFFAATSGIREARGELTNC